MKGWIRRTRLSSRSDGRIERPVNMPSVAAVLTMSAPSALLSAAVHSFIVGMGLYLGYVWTRNLDSEASGGDSQAVFITYVVSAFVCYFVYWLSSIFVFAEGNYGVLDEGDGPRQGFFHGSPPGRQNAPGSRTDLEVELPTRGPGHPAAVTAMGGAGGGRTEELVQAMREASSLRRELASLDSRIAGLLEGFVGEADEAGES